MSRLEHRRRQPRWLHWTTDCTVLTSGQLTWRGSVILQCPLHYDLFSTLLRPLHHPKSLVLVTSHWVQPTRRTSERFRARREDTHSSLVPHLPAPPTSTFLTVAVSLDTTVPVRQPPFQSSSSQWVLVCSPHPFGSRGGHSPPSPSAASPWIPHHASGFP